jgi:hypothetical protein
MTRAIDVVTITGAEYDALVDERDDLQEKLVEALHWKAAVDDAGVIHWTLTSETANNPRKAIGALLDTVSNSALDPAVSRDAAKLRDTHLHRAETAERELEAAKRDAALELADERERREAAEKDAARWLYARRFVAASEVADWPKWASRGHIESFEETCATVRAIDAAMKD